MLNEEKRIGQRTPSRRMSYGSLPPKPTAPCLVMSKNNVPHLWLINARGLGPRKRVLANGVFARQIRVQLDFLRSFDALFPDL